MRPGETHDVPDPPPVPTPAAPTHVAARIVAEMVAPHIGDRQHRIRGALRETVERIAGLRYLGHYTGADWDYAFEVSDRGADDVNIGYLTVGCNLIGILAPLNEHLEPLGTGALIRTVLHSRGGAIYCDTVMQGERIIGVTAGRFDELSPREPRVLEADRGIARLIRDLRGDFGQTSQDHGGYGKVGDGVEPWSPHGPGPSDFPTACREVLAPNDLQYVALVESGIVTHQDDLFGDAAVEERFFRAGHTVEARRHFYQQFAEELDARARDLGRRVHAVIGRGLHRIVFDVQRGAVYFYRVGPESYLMGVTLNQPEVFTADLKMEWLVSYVRP